MMVCDLFLPFIRDGHLNFRCMSTYRYNLTRSPCIYVSNLSSNHLTQTPSLGTFVLVNLFSVSFGYSCSGGGGLPVWRASAR